VAHAGDAETLRQLRRLHTRRAIAERLDSEHRHSYLRDFIYGAIDGAVTTFAVVAGVTGAGLSSGVIIVLGAANLLADGFSMAAGNYLGTRAERQRVDKLRRFEEHQIDLYPRGEREEIRQIMERKGFKGRDLKRAVNVVTADRKLWVDTMLQDEWGLSQYVPSPFRAALTTFLAFVGVGLLPLAPYLQEWARGGNGAQTFYTSTALTALAFFVTGALKSRHVAQHWLLAGVETLAVGSLAAALSYGVGYALRAVAALS
jgi:VIT1/CCC1 family predicted Fe2+/Mn2+ transporter